MRFDFGFRRKWMLAGFAAAFLIGDMLLYVREAKPSSAEFLFGVAGYALAHLHICTPRALDFLKPDALGSVPLLFQMRKPCVSEEGGLRKARCFWYTTRQFAHGGRVEVNESGLHSRPKRIE